MPSEDRFRETVLSVGPHLVANLKRIRNAASWIFFRSTEGMDGTASRSSAEGGRRDPRDLSHRAKVIERTMQGTRRMITLKVLSGSRATCVRVARIELASNVPRGAKLGKAYDPGMFVCSTRF